jgi:hypothetical protein
VDNCITFVVTKKEMIVSTTKFKGTQGEWKFNQGMEVDSSSRAIYRLSLEEDPTLEEYNANKKLFDASRELLEALQMFVDYCYGTELQNSERFLNAEQAINKALK